MKRLLLTFFLLLLCWPATAQYQYDFLQVLNPQRNWDARGGTIEEAAISVRPKGIYAEVGVFLTFSDRGAGFNTNEQLEVEFFFTLPEEAIVSDSWLWVGDEIVRAQMIDRWTASEIYEGIVNRRQDPSLLIKHDSERYELRVYPMQGGNSRKVKLTYLIPMRWTVDRVHVPLPFHWLDTSVNPVETLFMLAWPDDTWQNPYISEDPGIPVQHFIDDEFGEYDRIDIHHSDLRGLESLSYDAPLTEDGIFVSHLDNPEDGYYQLAYLPAAFTNSDQMAKKVAVLFDYDATKTLVSSTEMLNTARETMKAELKPTDLFNVLYSQAEIRRASDVWMEATPARIDSVFDQLASNVLASYTNLPALLADGLTFIEENDNGGSLLVISSSDALSNADVANQLIGDLNSLRDPLPTLLVLDIANTGVVFANINSRVYQGNAYLYTNLARLSSGQFLTIRSEQSLSALMAELLSGAAGSIQAFDLYATLEGGFTYGRFTSAGGFDIVPISKGILQVGKYIGDFPFVVEASGIHDSAPFSNRLTIAGDEALQSDSTVIAYWTGRQIDALERGPQDDQTIAEIIDYSLRARVMSRYTAFLALEPGINEQEPCGQECEDESQVLPIDIEDETPAGTDVTLEAYPNPFSSRATIKITLPEAIDLSEATFQVFNAMGQLVKSLEPSSTTGRVIELEWDGRSEAGVPVSNGVYFFVMTSPLGRHTIQLVIVR